MSSTYDNDDFIRKIIGGIEVSGSFADNLINRGMYPYQSDDINTQYLSKLRITNQDPYKNKNNGMNVSDIFYDQRNFKTDFMKGQISSSTSIGDKVIGDPSIGDKVIGDRTLDDKVIGGINVGSSLFNQQQEIDGRIVGGEAVKTNSYPWIVSLQTNGRHFCGGSLIHSNWVMSAKHCVAQKSNMNDLMVKVGGLNLNTPSQFIQRRIKRKIEHPNIDICLLELESPITERPSIRLNGNRNLTSGTISKALGWGLLSEGSGLLPNLLQQVNMPLVSDEDCSKSYPNQFDSVSEVCAGYELGGKDACQGDSGGPLIIQRVSTANLDGQTLIGITSWGDGCARAKKYGVWAKVASIIPWIKDYIPNLIVYDAMTGKEMLEFTDINKGKIEETTKPTHNTDWVITDVDPGESMPMQSFSIDQTSYFLIFTIVFIILILVYMTFKK